MQQNTHLLESTESDILKQLGLELISKRSFANSPNDADLIRRAKIWWAENIEIVRAAICKNERITSLAVSTNINRRLMLFTAIADLLTGIFLNVSPWTVSALVLQEGIFMVCPNIEVK